MAVELDVPGARPATHCDLSGRSAILGPRNLLDDRCPRLLDMNGTYWVALELDPRSRQWMADVEGLPVHSWGRTLGNVKQYAHEALAVHLDVPVSAVQGHLAFRTP